MLKKLSLQSQLDMFKTVITNFIYPDHEHFHLANTIDWEILKKEFALLNTKVSLPSVAIGTIVGFLLLK